MNKKNGFILYDALLSFLLISSTMLLLNEMVMINHQMTLNIHKQTKAINLLRDGIYQGFPELNSNDIYTNNQGGKYCVTYQTNKENKYCIQK